ncbi:hypothetical protein AB5I41_20305 [Sphingomonas sp. MMS24-JH45]
MREGRRAAVHKQRVRMLLFIGLMLCDVAAIRGGFAMGLATRSWRWLAPQRVEAPGWLILPIHLLVGLRNGAYAHKSLLRRSDARCAAP